MSKWRFITWTTYGSWLPGDPRGFQTWRGDEYVPPPKRYAKPGDSTYNATDYVERFEESQRMMVEEPFKLSPDQQRIALDAVVAEMDELPLTPAILAVGDVHVHFLSRFGSLKIRPAAGRIKTAATRALHDDGSTSLRIWSRNCHMKSKTAGREFREAFAYIKRHRDEGALIHVWPGFRKN